MVIERGKYRYSTDVGEIKSGKSVSALQENLSAAAEKTTQLPSGRFKGRGSKNRWEKIPLTGQKYSWVIKIPLGLLTLVILTVKIMQRRHYWQI